MSSSIDKLLKAQQIGLKIRPKVGGFPYLAESLRKSGVIRNIWNLPSCQSLFITEYGSIIMQGTPLVTGVINVPNFNKDLLINAIRIDQAGESTFPEFLEASWKSGVVKYEVDFEKRVVIYYGALNEFYEEEYPAVEIDSLVAQLEEEKTESKEVE